VSDADPEFLEIFRDEAAERLDSMVDALLALESGQGGDDAVASLFRDAHTIKGAAGMVGLDDVRMLAHAVEDLLSSVRETGSFPPELAAPLLRATDALRSRISGGEEPTDDLLDELAASRAAVVKGAARPARPEPELRPGAGDRRSLRVPAEKIDHLLDLVGEAVLYQRRLDYSLGAERPQELDDELGLGARLLDELKDTAVGMRTLPLATVTGRMPRAVRDIAVAEGKEVELVVLGAETELDRVILESLADPLVHILRNAVAHGIESPAERRRAGKPATGRIELRAEPRGSLVEIVVSDDGRGVPPELLEEARREGSLTDVLTRAGFSTASEVTELAGRGVGLDAVKSYVQSFNGSLDVRSEPGKGTEVVLLLPVALALLEVLLVERGGGVYGLPLAAVEEVLTVADTLSLEGRASIDVRGRPLSVYDLAALVAGVEGYLGAAILGDGRIALLLDPAVLTRGPRGLLRAAPHEEAPSSTVPKVLVVEDSFTVRELQRSILEAAGYRVATARDGRDALDVLERDDEIALVVTDLEMPELDGLELTRAIRADAARASLPVVIVTSRASEEDRQAGIEAGADAYMAKRSFDQQALLETVERLIGR
jgi:two-component system chemotaxis sensor kinase CheA